ncbi:zinc finger protein 280D isoform X1 [Xiphophorus maculatus]|nr:zinc finger protein 280D isoform X1 [Xiphophorus maculatus]
MPGVCVVYGCFNRSNREKDKRYFRVPKVVGHKGVNFKELTEKRREAWINNLRLNARAAQSIHARVCSDHFLTGCPSAAGDVDSQDWAPTVHLGYQRINKRPQTEASKQRRKELRSTMSELFMECVEEELEPWQKQVPQVHLIDDDDDDEPIFVGVLSGNQKDSKPSPAPPQRTSAGTQQKKVTPLQAPAGPSPIVLPLNVPVTTVKTVSPSLTTVAPQPVIVNNQGFIVTSPQLANSSDLIATLGTQYPPGTSFTIVPAPRQQVFQQVSSAMGLPGVVHRPQVQQIRNNVVTLANVQSPAAYSAQSNQLQPQSSNTPSLQIVTGKDLSDQSSVKRGLMASEVDRVVKRVKIDSVTIQVENGVLKRTCSKCHEDFPSEEAVNFHMVRCCATAGGAALSAPSITSTNKLIMLVADFYYGNFEGDAEKQEAQKTNTTFKCQSCLKVLKNNIRFMNHMKHHLELEKQNSESWESHTTCHHCYRQYMTPFQLQCHIESAHSPIESSTNCKICELAFESEQVLLEHMKANHKPGEMPYVCQVCDYRSSFFSDLEAHFRSVHENTKDLLCPFCLKVLRTSHIYMQHYMKHQKKGIHRCGKCRLHFLTYKEKAEHRTHVHKTFRKPKALEGLPPGTKVTIRASLTGKGPIMPHGSNRSAVTVTPEPTGFPNFKVKAPVNLSRSKIKDPRMGKAKSTYSRKQERRPSKHNLALKNLSAGDGCYTCIECNSEVDDFFSHFPMLSNCGACTYRTGCKVSFGNHMIKFHSTISKQRILKMDRRKTSPGIKLTLICLNCDLLVDASGGDLMSKHLTDQPHHTCRVIQEKDIRPEDKDQDKVHIQQSADDKETVTLLSTTTALEPEETDWKPSDNDISPSETLDDADRPELEQKLPADEQENDSPNPRSEEGVELKQPSSEAASPSSSDVLLIPSEESEGHTESLHVKEQLSVSDGLLDPVTGEKTP